MRWHSSGYEKGENEMDVISLGKAKKVGQLNKRLDERIGAGAKGDGVDVAGRVAQIEALDPKVGIVKRIGDVSKHTTTNLNKHNLRMQMHLDLQRSRLNESVVDTFSSTDSIEMSKSTGWTHESGVLRVAEDKARAVIVLKEEQSLHEVNLVFVSKTGLATGRREVPVSLVGGSGEDVTRTAESIALTQTAGAYPSSAVYWTDWMSLEGVRAVLSVKATTVLNGGSVSYLVKREGEEPTSLDSDEFVLEDVRFQIGVRLEAKTEEIPDRLTNGAYEGIFLEGQDYVVSKGESDLSMIVNLQMDVSYEQNEIMRSSVKEFTLFGSYDERKVR